MNNTDRPPSARSTWPAKLGCGLLVLLLVLAIMATAGMPLIRGRMRRQASRQLEQSGAVVAYKHQVAGAPPRSGWSVLMEQALGMDVEPALYISSPNKGWDDREVALLSYFPEVEGVDLGQNELNGPLLERLQQFKRLRTLSLGDQTATRQSLANLKHFPALEHLSLAVVLDDEAWQTIAKLTELQSLDLVHCQAAAPAPRWFTSAACRIEQVGIRGDQMDNAALLKKLVGWQSLHQLIVYHITLDDSSVEIINSLPNLERLAVHQSNIPARFSPASLLATKLQSVGLISCKVQQGAWERCSSWKGRPKFDLSGSAAVDEGRHGN